MIHLKFDVTGKRSHVTFVDPILIGRRPSSGRRTLLGVLVAVPAVFLIIDLAKQVDKIWTAVLIANDINSKICLII